MISLALFGCAGSIAARAADTPRGPILVELFTSEGCSSCPPADAWLRSIDASQPLPVIVLSEHVDYWDHDGWKDPYSSHLLTERQNEYEGRLHIDTPYTPQVIVDGTGEAKLGNDAQVTQVFEQSAAAPKIPVSITSLSVDQGRIRLHLSVDGQTTLHNADVYVSIALDHAESKVLHGENGGRRLVHTAVVEDLQRVGSVKKGSTFAKDVDMKTKLSIDPKNLRVIAFVQEPGPGKVLGSALQKP